MAAEPFKNRIPGIIFFGVIASLIATAIWTFGSHRFARTETTSKVTTPPPLEYIDSNSRPVRDAIRDYNQAYVEVSLSSHKSLEQLYHRAVKLAAAMTTPGDPGSPSFIERIKPSEVESLAQQLPGIVFYRNEIMGVKIDSTFFLTLARRTGTPADVEFFQNWKSTFPSNTWAPVYVQQQTDYSGCTDYDGGKLSDNFATWSAYYDKFPGDYAEDVIERLDAIRDALTEGTCACGDKESVEAELQRFLSTFPQDPSAPRVTTRLHAVQAGKSQIRFQCLSG